MSRARRTSFLGGAYQARATLIDEGAIGTPLAVAATMLAGGQETWHPDPDIFFKDGAGPLLDMGPYYVYGDRRPSRAGRSRRRVRVDARGEREIEIGPRAGERFGAETPTHTAAVMELDSGALATSSPASRHPGTTPRPLPRARLGRDTRAARPERVRRSVRMRQSVAATGQRWRTVTRRPRGARHRAARPGRGDRGGRAPRASGMRSPITSSTSGRSILEAAASGSAVDVCSVAPRPAPAPVEQPVAAAEPKA